MMPVLMMTPLSGGNCVDPLVVNLDLQPGCCCTRECRDEVDVSVLRRPHVARSVAVGGRNLAHRRVPNCTRQGWPVLDHAVEKTLVAADAFGDDMQEPTLEVGD